MFTLFSTKMPPTFYDVQTVDAHVLNPRHYPDLSAERNFSMLVTVGGYLRLEDASNGPLHEFSETFVLIPNRAKLMGKGAQMGKRDFLIQNQIFRFVVSHDPIQTAGWTSMDVDDMT
jgi:NTF2-related export protein 1/2